MNADDIDCAAHRRRVAAAQAAREAKAAERAAQAKAREEARLAAAEAKRAAALALYLDPDNAEMFKEREERMGKRKENNPETTGRKGKPMFDNIDNMAQIDREIEKRREAACEKNGCPKKSGSRRTAR